jgi:hypothetical protein
MEKEPDPGMSIQALARWATTRPQAYAVYLIAVILIGGLSFLAGTLNPKKRLHQVPPPISAPRN